jgi:exodeoxyribonuclease VII large subunit
MDDLLTVSVSEFVDLVNQAYDIAFPSITIEGELANFRVSKNKWVYFDLKDEQASVKFFGTIYMLPGPLEDGMVLQVRGTPRMHPLYGFSVTAQAIRPVGEGAIKRASELLQAKLTAEGLFDLGRKRALPVIPERIGLIASRESAAYIDFMKIMNARWGGVEIQFIDVQVQGEVAPMQVVSALQQFNQLQSPPEVIVITRGGGSAEDLQAFSTEQVTRAVALSRIPTLVAIGHERDISLAELAADLRASTPSNAAELLVPDRQELLARLAELSRSMNIEIDNRLEDERELILRMSQQNTQNINRLM